MVCEPGSETQKHVRQRYQRGMIFAALIYAGVVIGGVSLLKRFELANWQVIGLALLPFIPALMMLRTYLVYVAALDELQRRIQLEALAVAAGVIVFGSFAYGFLEDWAEFPHIPLFWIFPVFAVVFGVAQRFVRQRYQ